MSNTSISPGAGSSSVAGGPAATVLAGILSAGWSALAEGASGAPIQAPSNGVRQARFSVSGTFGSGGSIAIQGSPDGINWTQLGILSSASAPAVGAASTAALKVGPPKAVPTGTASINSVSGVTVPSVPVVPNDSLVVAVTDPSSGAPTNFFQPVVQGGDGTTALNVTAQLSAVGAI